MASSKSRRISQGRKFLYDQEVDQILQEEENSRKSLITSFPIADDLKQKIAKESNLVVVLKELEEYSKGVCSINVSSPDSSSHYVGSGFYIGDGWVLTTANVIRNRDQVRNATFAFFSTEGTARTYEARDRRAFVHRMMPPGRRPDYHNRDLTLVKLGVQFTRRRRKEDVASWEHEEQALLTSHKPFNFQNLITGKQSTAGTKPHEEDILCTVYHGTGNAADQNLKRIYFGFNVSRAYQVLDQRMLEFSGGFDATVSGSPLLAFRNGQFYFLGVFLPGLKLSYNAGTGNVFAYTGQALLWNEELAGHVGIGTKAVDKMSRIVPYTLDIPFNERAKLLMDKTVYEAAELALHHRVLIL